MACGQLKAGKIRGTKKEQVEKQGSRQQVSNMIGYEKNVLERQS